MNRNTTITLLCLLSAVLLSLPFLVPGTGFLMLVAFIPLLYAEEVASSTGKRRFFWWYYGTFVLWNALTVSWICNATVGGGLFAVFANALWMAGIFALFRWSRKRMKGSLPYLFLAFAWIAWEFFYLHWSQIEFPWLVLGNAFATTTSWIQWYEFTGTLGGSLWVWAANLAIFGILVSVGKGSWKDLNVKARVAAVAGTVLLFLTPPACSLFLRPAPDKGKLPVMIAQPNIDPYNKFGGMSQDEQNIMLLSQFTDAPKDSAVLLIAPETFTNDIFTNDYSYSSTMTQFNLFLGRHMGANFLFGASTKTFIQGKDRPSRTARQVSEGVWTESHNSAVMTSFYGRSSLYNKSKLVVGVEKMPYPRIFAPIDDKLGNVMGRCIGQKEVSNLMFTQCDSLTQEVTLRYPVGCAICYESIFGEHCAEYVKKGAYLLTVITNDAWWGNTPGYKQHAAYSSLRAIETRRWVARCANTGISCIIDPSGKMVSRTGWWKQEVLRGEVGLNDNLTFYVRYGDYIGRISMLMFVLLLAMALVRKLTGKTVEN